ncbi:NAD(P)-linked oxidoreductase superfamily protein [Striga asiatica]|uniref:NAD(P)-linked oxidoreductase superfamily protein n=1 Tax=Striga asiatica TaxID=4170 RepID=A0A5A7QZQ6_STRAF|nr:NAD(P)-linked oxidoreductase superfamily protein [Striga asiatica]
MASPPFLDTPTTASTPKSHFKRTVCLADWWLVKAENDCQGRRLAVSGYTSRGNDAMRVFSSAPIMKRYDVFTVETADGICVMFKGFINKNLTEENGFPADVCNHFVYGFPPHWKELEENIMAENQHPSVDNCEKDLGSQYLQQEIDVPGKQKGNDNESSAVSPERFEKESYPRTRNVEDQTILDGHVDCGNTEMELLSKSSIEANIGISAFTDKGLDGTRGDARGGIILPCQLRNKPTDDMKEMELDKGNCRKAKLDKGVNNTSRESLSHTVGRARTRSMTRLRITQEESKGSSVGPKASTSVDCEPEEGRGSENFEVFEFIGDKDEIESSKTDVGCVKDEELKISRSRKRDNDIKQVKTKGNINKAKRVGSSTTNMLSAADNQEDNVVPDVHTLPDSAKSLDKKTRRKLENVTPKGEKDKVCISPQGMSFSRSKSGRLRMPSLEFWRNQRAVYDPDGTLTGIKGILLDQQGKGMLLVIMCIGGYFCLFVVEVLCRKLGKLKILKFISVQNKEKKSKVKGILPL